MNTGSEARFSGSFGSLRTNDLPESILLIAWDVPNRWSSKNPIAACIDS